MIFLIVFPVSWKRLFHLMINNLSHYDKGCMRKQYCIYDNIKNITFVHDYRNTCISTSYT